MEINTHVVISNLPLIAQGLWITVQMCLASLALGILLGVVLCAGRMAATGPLNWVSVSVVEVFRIVPEVIIIFWMYLCLPVVLGIRLTSVECGIIALSVYSGAFLSEIFRAGINSVPKGQIEAADALALPTFPKWYKIIIPTGIRLMIPPFLNFFCDLVKVSSLLSLIGVAEITYQASMISSTTFRYMEMITVAGICYLLFIVPVSLSSKRIER